MATPAACNSKVATNPVFSFAPEQAHRSQEPGFSVTSRPSGLAGAASDGEEEAGGRVEHQDPDPEAAIKSVTRIPVSAEKLSKSGVGHP